MDRFRVDERYHTPDDQRVQHTLLAEVQDLGFELPDPGLLQVLVDLGLQILDRKVTDRNRDVHAAKPMLHSLQAHYHLIGFRLDVNLNLRTLLELFNCFKQNIHILDEEMLNDHRSVLNSQGEVCGVMKQVQRNRHIFD